MQIWLSASDLMLAPGIKALNTPFANFLLKLIVNWSSLLNKNRKKLKPAI